MPQATPFSRRRFVKSASMLAAGSVLPAWLPAQQTGALAQAPTLATPLTQFTYADVDLHSPLHEQQLNDHLDLLMSLSEDNLLKPIRQMAGRPAPGDDLGGWYTYDPHNIDIEGAYAPACTFGQWVSALARMYAIKRTPAIRDRLRRLNRLYAQALNSTYFEVNRFRTYSYDKLVCGLMDSHQFAQDPDAFSILEHTTDTALPLLPGHALENSSDESYTLSENLFLAYQRGAGARYKVLGTAYLDDAYYDPLSAGHSNFAGRHAYSHVNSLSSAMQAYLTLGSRKHLRAAQNGFEFLTQQSFATGGWGPNETLQAPGSTDLYDSLTHTHNSFETPCGSYAHFKLTRYLLCATGDSRYGDSMERVMYNTILGAKPIRADGRTFYYADYNQQAQKVYSKRRWPCCSGTLPQVAADYRISTYFRDARSVYANLYVPSVVRWQQGGAHIELTQTGNYPFESAVAFQFSLSKAADFALNLRIPAWALGAAVAVNGRRVGNAVIPGTFASIRRTWSSGDRVQLELPLTARLEAIDAAHFDTAALMSGPLVLFAIGKAPPTATRSQWLAMRKTGAQSWEVNGAAGPIRLLPFTAIADEPYSTYFRVS